MEFQKYGVVVESSYVSLQEMIPSSRLLVYHVTSAGHIAADSLTFPVISTPGKQVQIIIIVQ
jgi:hypothetical protein